MLGSPGEGQTIKVVLRMSTQMWWTASHVKAETSNISLYSFMIDRERAREGDTAPIVAVVDGT